MFPQINLAAFIERVDNTPFRNELFRNVDFLITDAAFAPKIAVEINDPTHHEYERRKRDEKVEAICAEAGFELQPYDQVFVRRSPSYNEQVNVTVDGEVLFLLL